jgi:hypothetical protein
MGSRGLRFLVRLGLGFGGVIDFGFSFGLLAFARRGVGSACQVGEELAVGRYRRNFPGFLQLPCELLDLIKDVLRIVVIIVAEFLDLGERLQQAVVLDALVLRENFLPCAIVQVFGIDKAHNSAPAFNMVQRARRHFAPAT